MINVAWLTPNWKTCHAKWIMSSHQDWTAVLFSKGDDPFTCRVYFISGLSCMLRSVAAKGAFSCCTMVTRLGWLGVGLHCQPRLHMGYVMAILYQLYNMLSPHCILQVSLHHRSFCLAVSRPRFYHDILYKIYGMPVYAVLCLCYSFSQRLAAILLMFSPSWSAIVFRICYAESWRSKKRGRRLEGSPFIHVLAKFGAIIMGHH